MKQSYSLVWKTKCEKDIFLFTIALDEIFLCRNSGFLLHGATDVVINTIIYYEIGFVSTALRTFYFWGMSSYSEIASLHKDTFSYLFCHFDLFSS